MHIRTPVLGAVAFAFVSFALFCVPHASADTAVTSDITTDTTWSPSDGPYLVSGQIQIAPGATLTIMPGTVIQFSSSPGAYSGIDVEGGLIADGVPGSEIYFTSDQDSSVGGSGAGGVPAARDYRGLSFKQGSTGHFENAVVRYADQGLVSDGGSVVVSESVFTDTNYGIIARSSELTLTDDTFTDNAEAVTVDLVSLFTHSGNTITGNAWLNGIAIQGESSSDPVLDNSDNLPYVFEDSGYAHALKSLTLEAGVSIYMNDPRGWHNLQFVNGQKLVVNGTSSAPVSFNAVGIQVGNGSSADIRYADFSPGLGQSAVVASDDASVAASEVTVEGGSTGFNFTNGATGSISDARIEHAGSGIVGDGSGGVSIVGAQILSVGVGLAVRGTSRFDVERTTIADSLQSGVELDPVISNNPVLAIAHSRISGTAPGFHLTGGAVTVTESDVLSDADAVASGSYDMRNNWWGDASGPRNAAQNPSGTGASVSDGITFAPWLGAVPVDTDVSSSDTVATVSAHHVPVIIVPGIMGTELSKSYGDMGEVWPAVDKLIFSPSDGFLDDLSLLRNGTEDPSRPMKVGDIIRSIQPPIGSESDTFLRLISVFTSAGYAEGTDLFLFPYDWRLDVSVDAARLKAAISAVQLSTGSQQVDIIAHSLGGLVVKKYIADNGSTSLQNVAYIGTPHLGAPKAAKALVYGDDLGVNFGPVHILNPAELQKISANMPSVYDLLPSMAYGASANTSLFSGYDPGSNVLGLDYQYTRTAVGRATGNVMLLDQANDLHQAIDPQTPPQTSVYNFVGCGDGQVTGKTIGGIVQKQRLSYGILAGLFKDDYQILYTNGDGTVPLFSAESSAGTRYYIRNVAHSELPSAPGVPETLLSLFTGSSISDTGAVTRYEPSCDIPGTVVSVHGPVSLDVYDGAGGHDGLTADGDTEETIPGVSLDTIGDASFAFIPQGEQYSVLVAPREPVSDGDTYDAYVQSTDEHDRVTSQSYFNALAVPQSHATMHVDYHPVDGSQPHVSSSDEEPPQVVYPSSTLAGDAVRDITAPSTTASMQDGDIVLSATDNSSGVLRTDYTFDEQSWQPYTGPVVPEGNQISFASTDNAGNVEYQETFAVPSSDSSPAAPAQDDPSGNLPSSDPVASEETEIPSDLESVASDPVATLVQTILAGGPVSSPPGLVAASGTLRMVAYVPVSVPVRRAEFGVPVLADPASRNIPPQASIQPILSILRGISTVSASDDPRTSAMLLSSETSTTALAAVAIRGDSSAGERPFWVAGLALVVLACAVRLYVWYTGDED